MKNALLALGLSLAVTPPGGAAVIIPLTNPGFEDDDVPVDTYTSSSTRPVGWPDGAGSSYIADGTVFSLNGIPGAHGGDQYMVLAGGGSNIRQDTSLAWSSAQVGDVFTISTWATSRSDIEPGTITFWINDTDQSNFLHSQNFGVIEGSLSETPGTWSLISWSYTVTEEALNAAASGSWDAVEIGFGHTGGGQTAFDDITFTYTPIPEPSTLLGSVILAGGMLLRRRRQPISELQQV
ncbi:PEP-CTERM sorting domain-containing protein [Haloferula sargassicola]|uniref:PEP-CTERM protein-sorting domain-containing protein n=1 Tax=Haloferula sargassicola TaxID=490096 RepID=A0ABP9UTM4_9BACT